MMGRMCVGLPLLNLFHQLTEPPLSPPLIFSILPTPTAAEAAVKPIKVKTVAEAVKPIKAKGEGELITTRGGRCAQMNASTPRPTLATCN